MCRREEFCQKNRNLMFYENISKILLSNLHICDGVAENQGYKGKLKANKKHGGNSTKIDFSILRHRITAAL